MRKPKGTIRPNVLPLDLADKLGLKEGEDLIMRPNPGLQTDVLTCLADEICCAGQKGAGKSMGAIMWLASGNPDVPLTSAKPVDISYFFHPYYVAVVVRKTREDLLDFVQKAVDKYAPWGAQLVANPLMIRFPKFDLNPESPNYLTAIPNTLGALIHTGHLDDEMSWTKYTGRDIHRLVFEEAVLVRSTDALENLLSCVRSPFRELRAQSMLNFNPLGPALPWLQRRYWYKDGSNETYASGEIQKREVYDPVAKKVVVQTRVWFFGKLDENKHMDAGKYRANLAATGNEVRKKAYILGEWSAVEGQFFGNFRPNGPMENEPENANHVIAAAPERFKPWMRCVYGADWAFNEHESAWVRLDADEHTGEIHVTEENAGVGRSTFDFGVSIGKSARGRVMAGGAVVVALSPDAWARESEVESEAARIMEGIGSVVGAHRVRLEGEGLDSLTGELEGMLVVRRAGNKRLPGWELLDSWMRWERMRLEGRVYNHEEAMAVMNRHGEGEYLKYLELWDKSLGVGKKLPVLRVWEECGRVIAAISGAPASTKVAGDIDKRHWYGADLIDALRYGAVEINKLKGREEPGRERLEREQLELAKAGVSLNALVERSRVRRWELAKEERKKRQPICLNRPILPRR